MGTDLLGIAKKPGPGFGLVHPPTPFDMFPPVDGETKGLGTNCHLRDVARGFPNRVRNAREQTVEINGRRADYPSLLIHLDPVAGRGN